MHRKVQLEAKTTPRRPMDVPRWLQDGPKTAPRWLQDGSKTTQDRPKTSQDASRPSQDVPRSPQDAPRPLQDAPRPLEDHPKIRSKTLQDLPQGTAKATPPQGHSKTSSHSDLGLNLVLNTKPGTSSAKMIAVQLSLGKLVSLCSPCKSASPLWATRL